MREIDVNEDGATPAGVELSPGELSPEALRGLVEEFVTRDGTDYGRVERSVEEKIAGVMAQLASGEARIVFDPETESANIVSRERSVVSRERSGP